jgi:hypothetical protein
MRLGKRTIGKATKKLAGAGTGKFTVKLSKAGKKAVRKAFTRKRRLTISLLATGTDPAGNKGAAKARVLVTRQR